MKRKNEDWTYPIRIKFTNKQKYEEFKAQADNQDMSISTWLKGVGCLAINKSPCRAVQKLRQQIETEQNDTIDDKS
jgi:hypothetical protein